MIRIHHPATVVAGIFAIGLPLAGVDSAGAADLTIASWGGSYQEAQSKALFVPAAKAMNIEVKEETYGGMSDVRLQVKAGAVTLDIVASGSGSASRAGVEGQGRA